MEVVVVSNIKERMKFVVQTQVFISYVIRAACPTSFTNRISSTFFEYVTLDLRKLPFSFDPFSIYKDIFDASLKIVSVCHRRACGKQRLVQSQK